VNQAEFKTFLNASLTRKREFDRKLADNYQRHTTRIKQAVIILNSSATEIHFVKKIFYLKKN